MQIYDITVLGNINQFLGIRVIRNRGQRKLWLVQDSYIDKIAARYNITTPIKPLSTPLPSTAVMLVPYEGQATPDQIYAYQQKVGSVNYAASFTRPNITRSVSKLSESLRNPSEQHLQAVNHLI